MRTARATATVSDHTGATTIPGTDVITTWTEVTPAMAEKWLENNTYNRNISRKHIDRLKKDIAAGRYHVIHQGVAFNENSILLDGQHRLIALSELNVSIWMLVTTGLPAAAQQAMDSGRKRGVGDWYEGKYRYERAAAARLSVAWQVTPGNPTMQSFRTSLRDLTTTEVLDLLSDEDSEAIESLATVSGQASRSLQVITHANLLGAVVAYGLEIDDAEEFLTGIHEIGGLEKGDPRIALVRMRFRSSKPYTQIEQFAFVMRAIDRWMNDKPMNTIKSWALDVPILKTDPRTERDG